MAELFRVKANPTFVATVDIPVAGEDFKALQLEMRHRRKRDLQAFLESLATLTQDQAVAGIVVGWRNVDTPFSADALADFLEEYPLAGAAIVDRYVRETAEAKRKN